MTKAEKVNNDSVRISQMTGARRPQNWILICVAAFFMFIISSPVSAITSKYDWEISRSMKRYLPIPYGIWGGNLLKAQYYQESLLNPNAVSHVGAKGIAQFMNPTWKDVVRELKIPKRIRPTNTKWAIRAGAYYMSKLRRSWKSKRKERDRYNLSLASYNAGFGNLLKAQRFAGGAIEFQPIIDQLHLVTGRHAAETRQYVVRIWKIYKRLLI